MPDHEAVKYRNEEIKMAQNQNQMMEQLLLSNKRYEEMFS